MNGRSIKELLRLTFNVHLPEVRKELAKWPQPGENELILALFRAFESMLVAAAIPLNSVPKTFSEWATKNLVIKFGRKHFFHSPAHPEWELYTFLNALLFKLPTQYRKLDIPLTPFTTSLHLTRVESYKGLLKFI